ncbi:MAG TPA: cache domain-containing protein [Magnetospirillum sp.]|nr:cache domain-containing protein [Magnetospirillum sp.]
MKKFGIAVVAALMLPVTAFAAEGGTEAEAVALVKQVVADIKANGAEKVYAEINTGTSKYVDRDLYPFISDLKGLVLAHGVNAKLVGKDASENQDVDGRMYVKERLEMLKTQQSFWHEYKFSNPTTKKIEAKRVYCEGLPASVVCVGVYKH